MNKHILDMIYTFLAPCDVPDVARGALDHGMIRWDGTSGRLEAYDGNSQSWVVFANLTPDTSVTEYQAELDWVRNRMLEEAELNIMRKKYPALEEAYTHYRSVFELVKDHD